MTNITDEAAKSLGLFNEALQKTITTISDMAPKAWHLMIMHEKLEATIEMIGYGGAVVFLLSVLCVCIKARNHYSAIRHEDIVTNKLSYSERNEADAGMITSYIIGGLSFGLIMIFVFCCIPSNILHFLYPDIYVAQHMIDKVIN